MTQSAPPTTPFASPNEAPVIGEIAAAIRERQSFLIAGHLRPDGDCLGSCLGLYELLRNMGKEVRVYNAGPVPDLLKFLPHIDKIETNNPTDWLCDATITVDSSSLDRISDDFRPAGFVINIDHHITNDQFGALNWVDTGAAASSEQIHRLAVALDQPVTPGMATLLYTGIMTDTGGFRFSNTDETTFHAAAHLVSAGADPADIADAVWGNRTKGAIVMTGEIYASLKFEFDGRFVWNEVKRELLERCAAAAEPEGLSSDMRAIEGVHIAVLFYETPEGFCRVGFRAKGKVNVCELAQLLGGGGHINASGATIREPYDQAQPKVLNVIRTYLQEKLKD